MRSEAKKLAAALQAGKSLKYHSIADRYFLMKWLLKEGLAKEHRIEIKLI